MTSDTDAELFGLLDQLWRIRPQGVSNIHGVPSFQALRDLLERRHGRSKPTSRSATFCGRWRCPV